MNELKTLIDLCPGTRLPQYEVEIFSDLVLAEYYLCRLCEHAWWHVHDDTVPYMAYCYARDVMKSRWPEAEAAIAADPQCAYWYAACVMKSRWPEAEAIIAESNYREWYIMEFGTRI